MNLAELLDRTNVDALDHLERQATIPVVDGLQAQGDLIVIPMAMLTTVTPDSWAHWQAVAAGGVELVRGVAGNNPHTLVADPDTCWWIGSVHDPLGLAIVMFENIAPVYLVHPEHGGSGVAPGRWLVRRQQERGPHRRRVLIAD
ncbi:hypothetical protein [Goodfellowiella coeruleoviolacea]|uniref:Uncharacterized protein n=1 Tax=Goodfellowiella coeruleoviolacea TaxID=334858 RepID=A0AAE3G9W1_9PSEU|nr:hypothetical protein [Goodfellowiella coeruleoviolacea]MCP2163422.1 hypothetical protein [Goodfellowiella coeruleoviolacea]